MLIWNIYIHLHGVNTQNTTPGKGFYQFLSAAGIDFEIRNLFVIKYGCVYILKFLMTISILNNTAFAG